MMPVNLMNERQLTIPRTPQSPQHVDKREAQLRLLSTLTSQSAFSELSNIHLTLSSQEVMKVLFTFQSSWL